MRHDYDENVPYAPPLDIEDNDYNGNWFEHREQICQLLKQGAIGFIGGIAIALFMTDKTDTWGPAVLLIAPLLGFICAGIPYGWSLINRITGNWVVFGNIIIMFLFYGFKFAASLFISFTAFPVIFIYHLIQSQKSKKRIRFAWAIVAILVSIYFAIGFYQTWKDYSNRSNSNGYSDTEIASNTVSTQSFVEDSTVLVPVIQHSLSGTLEEEKKCTDGYGWPVSQPTQLHGVFFLESKDPDDPHRNIMKKLDVFNAIAVVSGYFLDEGAGFTINEWEMDIWIYPNYSFDETGNLTYESEYVYCDNIRAPGMEEILDWFGSEYADMYLTELDVGEYMNKEHSD